MTLSHISEVLPQALARETKTLDDLAALFEGQEALDNPDVVLPMSRLCMTGEGLEVPDLGTFALTEWAREQLSARLGIRWDRWFAKASAAERAHEVNIRLSRTSAEVRLRTSRYGMNGSGTSGTLRAFVSPSYSAIPDSRIARLLARVLESAGELRVRRLDATDRSVTYVIGVGRPFRPGDSHEVGDVAGGLLVRNSGVGFASLSLSLHLERLLCKNGMTAPVPDALLLRRSHRGIDESAVEEVLMAQVSMLPGRLRAGAELLGDAERRPVPDRREAVLALLQRARLPKRHADPILAAWDKEPRGTVFGLVQAVTRAAQDERPELRFELERAAGRYLTRLD